jgi:hypothetical protein
MGSKKRDSRMGTPESVRHGKPAVKPDRVQKHKGGNRQKAAKQTDFLSFLLIRFTSLSGRKGSIGA